MSRFCFCNCPAGFSAEPERHAPDCPGRYGAGKARTPVPATTPALKVTAAEELDAVLHWRDKHTQAIRERDALQQRLTAAGERNDNRDSEIFAQVQSALRRSFSLGQIYWQQAGSDSTYQQNKSDQTMEVQEQHILNVLKSLGAALKPAEAAPCCTASAEERALLNAGDYTPEELFGVGGKPSCPKCTS